MYEDKEQHTQILEKKQGAVGPSMGQRIRDFFSPLWPRILPVLPSPSIYKLPYFMAQSWVGVFFITGLLSQRKWKMLLFSPASWVRFQVLAFSNKNVQSISEPQPKL